MSLRNKCTVLIKHTGTCISVLKVLARVKKEFLISRRSDKAFQELSFTKYSTKKYYFSAKLLDVEVLLF